MRWIILIVGLTTATNLFAYYTFEGGLLADTGTSVVVGLVAHFPQSKMLTLNGDFHYAYGSYKRGRVPVDISHHLFIPGVNMSVYFLKGRIESVEPYITFGGGAVLGIVSEDKEGVESETRFDPGGLVKIDFGCDFPIDAGVMPFVELGAWVIVDIIDSTDGNFSLVAGIRF